MIYVPVSLSYFIRMKMRKDKKLMIDGKRYRYECGYA